jgi:hypothetical protein
VLNLSLHALNALRDRTQVGFRPTLVRLRGRQQRGAGQQNWQQNRENPFHHGSPV